MKRSAEHIVSVLFCLGMLFQPAVAQVSDRYSGPIIDMHSHGPFLKETIEPIAPWLDKFDQFNVKKVVLTNYPEQLAAWVSEDPGRLMPSLMFPCLPQNPRQCFSDGALLPEIEWLREELRTNRVQIFGETVTQLFGISPDAPELSPYFALAEEFDIPFALHMGPGPAWAVATESIYSEFPDFQISAGNPLLLEEVLRQHPNLRLFIMHAEWPMLDEMLVILWHNPNVYVDVGHVQIAIERAEYYAYLRRLVEAGFSDRVIFGSDGGLNNYGVGIEAILDASFLTEEQKRDILYNNAARFLRLSEEEIAAHHAN